MAFFGSNKSRSSNSSLAVNRRGKSRSMRSQNKMIVRQMGYNQQSNPYAVQTVEYVEAPTKKQLEAQQLGFTGYSIKNGDLFIALDVQDILPEYVMGESNLITNGIFENIKVDKIALIYSPKKKMFMYLAINADFSCYVLFESPNFHDLPNISKIDIDILPVNAQVIPNANRLLNSVYHYIHNLCSNPILVFRVNELFKI